MKVLHLNTSVSGGAAIAALRLHRALRAKGIDSNFLSVTGESNAAEHLFSLEEDGSTPDFAQRLKRGKRKRYFGAWRVRLHGKPKELFSFPSSSWQIEEHPLVQAADVIHLHWVAGMIDVPGFFSKIKKPVVWTLHDAWPFTGGFHYQSYFNTKPFRHLARKNLEIMRAAYAGKQFSIVAPSAYMIRLAQHDGVFKNAHFSVIQNVLPQAVFHPQETNVRKEYHLDENKQVLFFACEELDYYRKGADLLFEAFSKWKNENVQLLVAGIPGKFHIPKDKRIRFIGQITSEEKMAQLLAASDLVLHASREDNFPNTILEAIFCGTPVLSTRAGGVPEMIHDGVTGWLTEENSAAGILKALERSESKILDRAAVAKSAVDYFSPEKLLGKYCALYEQCLRT